MSRQIKVFFGLALIAGSVGYGQTQEKPEAFVRRFSVGATLSVLGLNLVPKGSSNIVTTTPVVDSLYTTTPASQRIGYGAMVQASITGHFAVNVSLLTRRIGYILNTDVFTGSDNPSTAEDERIHSIRNEDTRARFYDLPVTVRYYGKERHEPGVRWFVEGGGVLRRISKLRSSETTTDNSGVLHCCTFDPAVPARRNLRGLVVGAASSSSIRSESAWFPQCAIHAGPGSSSAAPRSARAATRSRGCSR